MQPIAISRVRTSNRWSVHTHTHTQARRCEWTRPRAVVGRLRMAMDAENEGSRGDGDHQPVSLPPVIPMSSLAPTGEEGQEGEGRGRGLDALTRAWESAEAPLGGYSEDDE